MANYDLQRAMQQQRLGNMTSKTAGYLAGANADLREAMIGREALGGNLGNVFDTFKTRFFGTIEKDFISPFTTRINEAFFGPGARTGELASRLGAAGPYLALGALIPAAAPFAFRKAAQKFQEEPPTTAVATPWHQWMGDILKKGPEALRPAMFDYPDSLQREAGLIQ
jgi:hypothetical protein